jgi:uncharacterized protein (DUF1501 family)
MMRSEGGPEVAVIEANGWDTHANQGGARGALAQRLAGLDKALRALKDRLGPLWQQTAVLVVTERVDAKTLATRIFPDSSGARPLQGLIRA